MVALHGVLWSLCRLLGRLRLRLFNLCLHLSGSSLRFGLDSSLGDFRDDSLRNNVRLGLNGSLGDSLDHLLRGRLKGRSRGNFDSSDLSLWFLSLRLRLLNLDSDLFHLGNRINSGFLGLGNDLNGGLLHLDGSLDNSHLGHRFLGLDSDLFHLGNRLNSGFLNLGDDLNGGFLHLDGSLDSRLLHLDNTLNRGFLFHFNSGVEISLQLLCLFDNRFLGFFRLLNHDLSSRCLLHLLGGRSHHDLSNLIVLNCNGGCDLHRLTLASG
ncbi:hypothetical protein ATCC90586_012186 [Pythium insidiosum]|nr:hypothetical protein ATCC90586_012186 [Pythium insidiosum]